MNCLRSHYRGGLCAVVMAGLVAFAGSPAHADLGEWVNSVNSGTPANIVATNVTPLPTTLDIGTLPGDTTYEFIVNARRTGASSALIGKVPGGQAIKFNQWDNTGRYGTTAFGVADYDFGVPTTFDADVVLAFVSDKANNKTSLFVNGVDSGASVPMALSLGGEVGIGGALAAGGTFWDPLDGQMLGLAIFNRQLTAGEIRAHAGAFTAAPIPEPGTLAMLAGALPLLGLRRRRKG